MKRREFINTSIKALASVPLLSIAIPEETKASEISESKEIDLEFHDYHGHIEKVTYCLKSDTITLYVGKEISGYFILRKFTHYDYGSHSIDFILTLGHIESYHLRVFHPSLEFNKVINLEVIY